MATTVSIQDRGDGTYVATDTDGQTVIIKGLPAATAAAAKVGIKIKSANDSTGYTNSGNAYSGSGTSGTQGAQGTDQTVIINGKPTLIADAIKQAQSAKNLGLIRKNLIASGQLTKAEARDPNNLLNKWSQIVYGAAMDADPKNKDPFVYAKSLQAQGFGSTYGTQQQTPYTTISSSQEALNAIQSAFNNAYHRLPTDAEVKSWTAKLNKAQAANPSKPVMVNGVLQYQGGLGSADLWVANQLMNTKEYKDVQARVNSAAAQTLQGAAADNGVTLTPGQINDFTNRLAHGENIDTIKSTIRDLAGLGQPDSVKNLLKQGVDLSTIYSPYKQMMSQILEVNPQTITLNDPTLRSAITPQGEMSLYDYQNALRKDPRWQYTNNAKTAVSDSVSQVLKDFGFMG